MKNTIEAILKRPIATAGLVGFVSYCAIRVIKAIKGVDVEPLVKITVDKVVDTPAE
jgi:hypothetical protein